MGAFVFPDLDVFSKLQTLQDVFAARAANTIYTNTTNDHILLFVTAYNLDYAWLIDVDGIERASVQCSSATAGLRSVLCCIIPPGSTYRVYKNGGPGYLVDWQEFRT